MAYAQNMKFCCNSKVCIAGFAQGTRSVTKKSIVTIKQF